MPSAFTATDIEQKLTAARDELDRLEKRRVVLTEMIATFDRWRKFAEDDDHSWLNLRFHEAVKRVLKEVGRPLTSRDIAQKLQERGVPTKSTNVPNLVYVTMRKRAEKEGFVLDDMTKKWSLKEWKKRKTT